MRCWFSGRMPAFQAGDKSSILLRRTNMEEITKKKARGICIYNGKLLVIERLNLEKDFDQKYYVLPGGDVEDDESLEDAVLREFDEETSIKVKLGELFLSFTDESDDIDKYYYLCTYVFGEPILSAKSEEAEKMKKGRQVYTPMWLPLSELKNINLYPEEVKEKILKKFT